MDHFYTNITNNTTDFRKKKKGRMPLGCCDFGNRSPQKMIFPITAAGR